MRKSTVKSLTAAIALFSVLALSACNRGYGCPNAMNVDVEQPAPVERG